MVSAASLFCRTSVAVEASSLEAPGPHSVTCGVVFSGADAAAELIKGFLLRDEAATRWFALGELSDICPRAFFNRGDAPEVRVLALRGTAWESPTLPEFFVLTETAFSFS